jgi:Ca2+-transporting ATPase
MSIFLLLGGIFLFTFLVGILLEKFRIPWIFAALILGLILAFQNPFEVLTSSETFKFLAWLGMYFLLFLIGFELDLKKIKTLGKFIIKSTFFIIFFEAFFGSLLVHSVFGYSWFISILVALSFATVGEAVLIPILDEFKLTKTKLGQSILGIGTLDDIIEVFLII